MARCCPPLRAGCPPVSRLFYSPSYRTHTLARARSHTHTHTRARARAFSHSRSHTHAHTVSLSLTPCARCCSHFLVFLCPPSYGFGWARGCSSHFPPAASSSSSSLSRSLPPSLSHSLSLLITPSLSLSLSLSTCLQQFSHTHIKHTRGWTQCPRMGAASVQRCSCHDIWSDMALKMSMCTSNNHC